jgi:hypothetical protein
MFDQSSKSGMPQTLRFGLLQMATDQALQNTMHVAFGDPQDHSTAMAD